VSACGPQRGAYCPVEYETRISALTDLIRWGPSILSHAEFLVLLFLAERTLTYGKRADACSLAQFTNGIYSRRKGVWIRPGCGLSPTAVKNAVIALADREILICQRALPGSARYNPGKGNQATEYEINWTRLHSQFRMREGAPLGRSAAKPLGKHTTKPLSQQASNNRGKSSSKETSNRERSGGVHGSRAEQDPTDKPSSEEPECAYKSTLVFASPKEELAYLVQQRGDVLNEADWFEISAALELRGVPLDEFVAYMRRHLLNPKTVNPIGLIKSKVKAYRAMTRPAVPDPAPASDHPTAQAREEKCPLCGEPKGKGVKLVGGRFVACECATPEWRAKIDGLNLDPQMAKDG